MYLSYIDESGDTGTRGSRHLLLGAAVLFEGRWASVQGEIQHLLKRYFPAQPRPAEIHCTDVRGGRNEFKGLTREQRNALLHDFCQLALDLRDDELRMFTVIFDKVDWWQRNPDRSGDDLYLQAFENLVARIDLFLRRRYATGSPSKTLLIVDPHSTSMSKALKAALGEYQREGTRWSDLKNVVETVMLPDRTNRQGFSSPTCVHMPSGGWLSTTTPASRSRSRTPLTASHTPRC